MRPRQELKSEELIVESPDSRLALTDEKDEAIPNNSRSGSGNGAISSNDIVSKEHVLGDERIPVEEIRLPSPDSPGEQPSYVEPRPDVQRKLASMDEKMLGMRYVHVTNDAQKQYPEVSTSMPVGGEGRMARRRQSEETPAKDPINIGVLRGDANAALAPKMDGGLREPAYLRYIKDGRTSVIPTDALRTASPLGATQSATTITSRGPGAFPSGPMHAQGSDDWLQDNFVVGDVEVGHDATAWDLAALHNTPISQSGDLAVADLVQSKQFSMDDREEAEQVDVAMEERRRAEQKRKSNGLLIGLIFLTCCVLVSGVAGVFISGFGAADDTSEALEESFMATLAPTSQLDGFMSTLPVYTIEAVNKDESSPQAKALRWLLLDPGFPSYPDWRKVQRFALATFFYSTEGRNWMTNSNWLSYSKSECEWFASNHVGPLNAEPEAYGLIDSFPQLVYESGLCSMGEASNGKVQRLVFFGNALQGTFPQELALLTELRALAAVNNPIGGTIPTEIGLLTNLEYFSSVIGGLQGSIPSELGNARNMTQVILYRNQLSGTIPTELGRLTNMKGLMLDQNNLDGTMPTELGLLSNAVWLSSYNNDLTGKIPTQLGMLSHVRFLAMFGNQYQSTIPSQLGTMASLQELNFEGNHITGTLPTELGQLKNFKKLFAKKLPIWGPIPSEFGLLPNLSFVDVGACGGINGTIPTEIFMRTKIQVLKIEKNKISGSLPTEIGMASHLQKLYIDTNGRMTGSLPTEIGLATQLRELGLHTTQITGTIPAQMGWLSMLEILDLCDTHLSGTIPVELSAIDSLSKLCLRHKWGPSGSMDLGGVLPPEICAGPATIEIDCDAVECPDDCNCDCVDFDNQTCQCGGGN